MADVNIVVEICGTAGEGTISAGEILTRCMSDQGFEIMSFDSYPAEIRGFGKCFAHSRISNKKILSPGKYTDILVSLNDAHSISQLPSLRETGIVIFDNKPPHYLEEDKSIAGWIEPGMISYGVPLLELAQKAAGSSRGRNMVALGAISALFDIDPEAVKATIRQRYALKKKSIITANINSFVEGYRWTLSNVTKIDKYRFKKPKNKRSGNQKHILSGNQAVAMAAIDCDLKLYAGYPITPATKIMEILSKELPKRGGVMIQTEDEMSALGNVIGAGFAGKRAMTATSGPGFCLMTELISLSVMAEVPAVIINSQRGGPSTGLPTKTEQSDLEIAVYGGSGDSPRIVLAPTNVEECYQCASLAFYLAEKYQGPVIVLLDFFLSNSIKNIHMPKAVENRKQNANITPSASEMKDYKRYKITKSGISPRTIPGTPNGMFVSTGLEHDEWGRPAYESKNHMDMTEKRYRKLQRCLTDVPKPIWYGEKKDISVGILAWGSTAGPAREAVIRAQKTGIRVAMLKSVLMYPLFSDHLKRFGEACRHIIIPELNFSGQFANLVAPHLNCRVERFNRVTGLPFPAEDIFDRIKESAP